MRSARALDDRPGNGDTLDAVTRETAGPRPATPLAGAAPGW